MTNLTAVCADINNYFAPISQKRDRSYIHRGTFEIIDGVIDNVDFLKDGQYFRIVGSDLNDGVYCNVPEELSLLRNERFSGAIWAMAVPPDFVKLCEDIGAFNDKMKEFSVNYGGFVSESYGGYSYQLPVNAPAHLVEWKREIDTRLNSYRRLHGIL